MIRCKASWMVAATFGLMCAGCGVQFDPDAAVLAGSWTATLDDGRTVSITFDAAGTLDTVTVTALDGTASTANVGSSTSSVDGDQVVVSISTGADPITYTATLSADGNTLTGTLSDDIPFTDVDVTVPSGALTLTKVQTGG